MVNDATQRERELVNVGGVGGGGGSGSSSGRFDINGSGSSDEKFTLYGMIVAKIFCSG